MAILETEAEIEVVTAETGILVIRTDLEVTNLGVIEEVIILRILSEEEIDLPRIVFNKPAASSSFFTKDYFQ